MTTRDDAVAFPVDPRQRRISERLRLVGTAPAQAYEDALKLISGSLRLHTESHLAGHLAREINGALRAVFEAMQTKSTVDTPNGGGDAAADPSSGGKDKYWLSIQRAAAGLGIPPDDGILKLWREVGEEFIEERVHRVHLSGWHTLDQRFRTLWDQFETVLDHVLDRFMSRITASHAVLDALLEIGPTADAIKQLREKVPHNSIALERFFGKASGDWLEPLRAADFFRHPPAPIVDDEGRLQFPPWPQIDYLKRVAPTDPSNVAAIVTECPATQNPRIHAGLAEVLCLLPEAQAADLIEPAIGWLDEPFVLPTLVDHLTTLAQRLASAGYSRQAFALSRALLALGRHDEDSADD